MNYTNNRILSGSIIGITESYLSSMGGNVEGKVNIKGTLTLSDVPVYTDNEAANKAGLAVGVIYRTPSGELKIKF